MTISTSLSLYVEPRIQRRGHQYFRDNRVSLLNCHGTMAEALVSGGEIYRVRLARDGELLRVSCSCPFFEDRGRPCKHVWASILAVDERYGLRGGDGSFPQCLVSDSTGSVKPKPVTRSRPPGQTWREIIDLISGPDRAASRDEAEIVYVVDAHESRREQQLSLEIWLTRRKIDGTLGARRHIQLARADIPDLPDSADRRILSLLAGAEEANPYLRRSQLRGIRQMLSMRSLLPESVADMLLPVLCATGRCRLQKDPESEDLGEPLTWDEGAPWELWLELRDKAPHGWELHGSLRRDGRRLSLAEPDILLGGLVFTEGRVGRIEVDDSGWIPLLRRSGALPVPATDLEELLERLCACPEIPRLDLPESLGIRATRAIPQPLLRLLAPAHGSSRPRAELFFLYEGHELPAGAARRAVYEREVRRLILRDLDDEAAAVDRLRHLGFRDSHDGSTGIHPSRVPRVVDTLLAEAWLVEAQGKLHRPLLELKPVVSSGIAWFELRAEARFAGASAGLQQILDALKRKTMFVPLGDGSVGVLPKEWLRRLSLLAALGPIEGDRLIFRGARTALLDAWLDDHPQAIWDKVFDRARQRLRSFQGLAEAEAPPGFQGELRGYQRAGLGWLHFLRDIGFGGCLADDMGLGKTVQVLALLEARRTRRKGLPPSLVVVPKSLVFNWLSEAARFTPKLRVLNYTGPDRRESEAPFAGHDVVLTTYGTLRRDIKVLKQVDFDSLILDEAQAIKNADSQTARAVRLLRGSHRLALSGTPVENHLGELWSLLAFLNPGLIESSPLLSERAEDLRNPSPEVRELLARALRPFFLRRTKEQVAPELPRRQEQTLVVELPPKQRRLYDELRSRFHETFARHIAERGLGGRTKILFLEALLRLRQAACHPGLLDPKRVDEPSAKLDLLLPQLQEILAEGHKALVFSQFTSLLGLLRRHLDREGIPYLYLDGRTRDRQEKVELFQSDPAFPLFLISLKAGGLGLNLTAADYVYLLDPWWNPAVEAQAIDRAHRIGQTRPVFASRLVARDTVEEKILELQKSKRELADAIIQADKSLLAALSREDLELLLS